MLVLAISLVNFEVDGAGSRQAVPLTTEMLRVV